MKKSELRKMIREEIVYNEHDKQWLHKEIRKLEDAYKVLNASPLLSSRLGVSEYSKMIKNIWKSLSVGLNSAKLDYETNFGKGNWKVNPKGFPK